MKAIRIYEYGASDVMRFEDVPTPDPKPGTVRVKNQAIGVNYIDIYQRSGASRIPLPFTTGQEAAGVVDAVGDGVTEFKPGDRVVYGFTIGAYAEYNLVPAEKLVALPANVDSKLAAAALLQGMTAHYLTEDTFPLQPGHTALIHAAAGGTGQLVVQRAKACGARVIATVGSAEKAQIALAAGADEIINYREQDFEAEVKRLTDGRGVDVVYDSVGKDTFDKSLNCLRPRGYMVLFGQSSGAVPPFEPQTLAGKGSLVLTRPTLGHFLLTRDELLKRADAVLSWLGSGQLHVRIDREYPLSEASAAHDALASRATSGKILLIP